MRELSPPIDAAVQCVEDNRNEWTDSRSSDAPTQPNFPPVGTRSVRMSVSAGDRGSNGSGAWQQAMSHCATAYTVWQQRRANASAPRDSDRQHAAWHPSTVQAWAASTCVVIEPASNPTTNKGATRRRTVGEFVFMASQFYARVRVAVRHRGKIPRNRRIPARPNELRRLFAALATTRVRC